MTADQNVDNLMNGAGASGALPEALVAMLYNANLLGLSKDYAYKESANTSASRYDQITTMAKILTRTHTHADGNSYDIWDAVQTILKWVLAQDLTINNGEVNSVTPAPPKPAA
jgi:hypothetical protein